MSDSDSKEALNELSLMIEDFVNQLTELLEDKIKVTVLIRNCELTDSDVLYTSDETREIITAVQNLQDRGERVTVHDSRYQDPDEDIELPEPAWKPKRGMH